MSRPEDLEKLFQHHAEGLKLDLTPAPIVELVTVAFDDGTVGEVPAGELTKIG